MNMTPSLRTTIFTRARLAALAASSLLLPASLFAQAFPTWQGTGTNWSTPANWDETFAYGQLEWQGAGNATSWNDNATNPLSMWRFYFNGSQAYTLGGGAVSFFDFSSTNGGILNDSSVTQTINNNINFSDNGAREMFILNRSTSGGALTFNGTVTLTNSMTYLGIGGTNGSGNITFNGPIVGNKGIVIGTNSFNLNGVQMVGTRAVFNGSNSYTGTTTILRGLLSITNGNSLSTNSVILGLGGVVGLIDAGLTVNGTTTASNNFRFADAGTNVTLTVTNGAAFTITGALANDSGSSATTKFSKAGAGTLILANGASTYAGQIQIGDGTVVIGQSAALGTNILTSPRGIDLGLNLRDVNQTNNVSLLLSNGVTLSNSIYVAPNTISGTNYTRAIGIAGSGNATISNQVFLDGNLTLDVGAGNNLTTLNVPANNAFTGTGGLIKTGAGTWVASGNSSYTGKTVLAGGVTLMTFPSDTRFGAAPASFTADSLTISNASRLVTSNSASSTLNWNANRGITIGDGGGAWQITGNVGVVLAGNSLLNGTGNFEKTGSGTLTLSASNSFSGTYSNSATFAGTTILNHELGLANSTLIKNTNTTFSFSNTAGTNFTLGGLATSATGTTNADTALTNSAGQAIKLTVGGNNQSTTYNGVLSQGGSLVKAGTGTLTLGGANTFTGFIDVTAGAIVANAASVGDINTASSITLSNSKLLVRANGVGKDYNSVGFIAATNATSTLSYSNESFSTGRNFTLSGASAMTLNGNLIISNNSVADYLTNQISITRNVTGTGTLTVSTYNNIATNTNNYTLGRVALSGNNSGWSGDLVIARGSAFLSGGVTNAVGTGKIIIGTTGDSFGAALTAFTGVGLGSTLDITNDMIVRSGGFRSLRPSTDHNVNFTGDVSLEGSLNVDEALFNSNRWVRLGGDISGVGGISVTRTGNQPNTEVRLSGSNSFTGATTVTSGTLRVNSTTGSALGGTTNVSVASGATLLIATSEQVNNSASVTLSGGTITRGAGVSETFGDLNVTSASTIDFGSTAESSFFQFGTITGGANLTIANFLDANEFRFAAADFAAGETIANSFTFLTSDARNYSFGSGTFTITAIPEPSTVIAAIGLSGLMLWHPLRRRFRKQR